MLNTIWGWSKPEEHQEIEGQMAVAGSRADADGRWEAHIKPPPAGGPYGLKIDGPQHIELHNVLVGDVWLCGGQSNMELPLARTRNGDQEISQANHPEIRLYKVGSRSAYSPVAVPQGTWKVCTPGTIADNGGFSAVAYFFACRVQQDTRVPIGLVEDCLGGTPAEAWTSEETLRPLRDFDAQLTEMERLKAEGGPVYGNFVMPCMTITTSSQEQHLGGGGPG